VIITVAGRPAAVLGPVPTRSWRHWEEISGVFGDPVDADWAADRDLIDADLIDADLIDADLIDP
jgi:antitoxin (DNA-binding transcriptional repressor) of toxin-antitoxin stability system